MPKFCKRCTLVRMPNNYTQLCIPCKAEVKAIKIKRQTAKRKKTKEEGETLVEKPIPNKYLVRNLK